MCGEQKTLPRLITRVLVIDIESHAGRSNYFELTDVGLLLLLLLFAKSGTCVISLASSLQRDIFS